MCKCNTNEHNAKLFINNYIYTTMKTTINERIKVLRTHLNLTQSEFSHLIGLNPTQLSRIENGTSNPQKSTLKEVFKAIEVSNEWLLEGKGELKASIRQENTNEINPWKDALVSQVKEENTRLQKELERVWQMVQHLTGGAKPNFLNAPEKASCAELLALVSGVKLSVAA